MADPPAAIAGASTTNVLIDQLDLSSPEAEAAMNAALRLVLEIRNEVEDSVARRVAIYERTLGLAVLPILIRRRLSRLWRQRRTRRLRSG